MTAMSGAYAQRFLVTLFLVSFGTYLFLATVTYTPFDPGWMHISSDTQYVSNASGVAGAWLADLLFGFLGWAALLIPIFLFIEAIQVWWPRSFLTRPFRYVAQFFILLVTSSLLFLCWNVPADTLENASGGIIGYEIGQSLESLLTVYGAGLFLFAFWVLLVTFAYGIRWDKTWITLQRVPSYLQDLFYHNEHIDQEEKHLYQKQLAAQQVETKTEKAVQDTQADQQLNPADAHQTNFFDEDIQQFEVMQKKLAEENAKRSVIHTTATHEPLAPVADIDDETLEKTIQKAHQLTQDTQKVVATGEVWRAIPDTQDPRQDIDALLRAADAPTHPEPSLEAIQPKTHDMASHREEPKVEQQFVVAPASSDLDWDDDLIFDELKSVVPRQERQPIQDAQTTAQPTSAENLNIEPTLQTASHFAAPVTQQQAVSAHAVDVDTLDDIFDELDAEFQQVNANSKAESIQSSHSITQDQPRAVSNDLASSLDDLAADVTLSPSRTDNTDHFTAAPLAAINETVSVPVNKEPLSKEEFLEAWVETAGLPAAQADEDDFDAPLKDSAGRPLSRAMQVAERRKDLSPLPGLDLLDPVDPNKKVNFTAEQLARLSELLEIKLQEFNVKAKVVEAQPGPVVTRFELDLAPGVKASKVTNISRDLARSMSMASVRVVEVIPGKPYIGIEVPNSTREMVRIIELLQTPAYSDPSAILSMAMGKDISGNPVITELGKAPHMLVAGTTGSGKSVAVNSMILSMLLKYTPDQLRLILIDPKQLELANYNDIPHLLTPVVTDMKDAVSALNWCVNEMERRYKLMSFLKIRKLADYNRKVEEAIANGEDLIDPTWKASDSATQERAPRLTPLPSIVIVADEFADMIMQVGKKAEEMITRLAQKSRAAGIHLLLATQRPSVDVITGLIKANIPTRVALRVNSKIDSRTILDAGGAEDLLGHGDMLFLGPGKIEPERVHGAFISDDEVNRICDAWRERGSPNYVDEILTPFDEDPTSRGFEDGGEGASDRDPLYDQCVAFVLETRKASTSSLQRKFSLGYNRAARIIDQMEEHGIVSSMGANGKREILV